MVPMHRPTHAVLGYQQPSVLAAGLWCVVFSGLHWLVRSWGWLWALGSSIALLLAFGALGLAALRWLGGQRRVVLPPRDPVVIERIIVEREYRY